MADQFKAGDVVRLKSGGPKMTVAEAGKIGSPAIDAAKCLWITPDGTFKHEIIQTVALVAVGEAEDDSPGFTPGMMRN